MRLMMSPNLYLSLAMFLGITFMALSDSRDLRVIAIAPVAVLYTLSMGFYAMQAYSLANVQKKVKLE